jgi:hypothetical protein
MAITTRETTATGVTNKGSPLTNAEVDNNFVEIVASLSDKLETVAVDDLSDVTITSVQNGDILKYNGTAWVNDTESGGAEVNDLTSSVTWANVPDANITQSSVTQHEAALTISSTQVSDFSEAVDDEVNTLLQAGLGVDLTYDDVNNELTIDSNHVEVNCTNQSGASIPIGTPVYQTGVSGNNITIAPADADDSAKMPAIGMTTSAIANGAEGTVVILGVVKGLDTSAFTAGDTVYVSTTAGALTTTAPTGESGLIQNFGRVLKVNAASGSIAVMGAGRANAVANLNNGNVFIGNASNQAETRALTASDIQSGTFADARIAQSNVTQHQAALSVTESQISDLGAYITASSTDTLTNKSGNISQWTNDSGYLTSYTETDPVFSASAASGISSTNISNWNTAYSWGNHASAGYASASSLSGYVSRTFLNTNNLVINGTSTGNQAGLLMRDSESAMMFQIYGTGTQFGFLDAAWGNWDLKKASGGALEIDISGTLRTVWHTGDFTSTNVSNWNTAYGWGNHASAGYASSSSVGGGAQYVDVATDNYGTIKVDDDRGVTWAGYAIRTNWVFMSDGATNCGIYNDTDNQWMTTWVRGGATALQYSGSTKLTTTSSGIAVTGSITATGYNSSNWDTAYGWGNHASQGYITNSGGTEAATGSTVAKRDSSADLHARLFRSSYANQSTISGGIAFRINNSVDNYIRFCSDGAAIRSFIGAGTSSFSGSYNDLSNKPTIPTNNNQLTNGAGYITSSGSISGNAATATWADQVDVNSGNASNAWYPVVWHSGDTVYSSSVQIYAGDNYLKAHYLNMWHASSARTSDTIFYSSNDDYIRKTDGASFRTSLNVPTRTGGNASGTWGISITGSSASCTGNAATATNADQVDGIEGANILNKQGTSYYQLNTWLQGTAGHGLYFPSSGAGTHFYPSDLGNYGSFRVDGRKGGWSGISLESRAVFMHDGASGTGIFNDVHNHWLFYGVHTDKTAMYFNGAEKIYTYASGGRVTGDFLATGDVYAYYSDERLKEKTGKIENALDKVDAIETFYYTHNDKAVELGYEGKEQQVGVSAQSVAEVMPEVVHLAPIDDDGKGNSISGENYQTVNYARLVPLLIESIKELRAEIEELKRGV